MPGQDKGLTIALVSHSIDSLPRLVEEYSFDQWIVFGLHAAVTNREVWYNCTKSEPMLEEDSKHQGG